MALLVLLEKEGGTNDLDNLEIENLNNISSFFKEEIEGNNQGKEDLNSMIACYCLLLFSFFWGWWWEATSETSWNKGPTLALSVMLKNEEKFSDK